MNVDTLKKMLPLLAMVASGVMAAQQRDAQSGAGAGGDLMGKLGAMFGGSQAASGSAGLGKLIDLDGDGNPLDDIVGLASKLMGR